MPGMAYLDSSALLKLVVEEPGSWALSDYLAERDRCTSDLSRVELLRAVRRRGLGTGAIGLAARVLDSVELLTLDEQILSRASELGPPTLRSLDAIHLSSALALGRELVALVTYDRRLADSAEHAGLRVESPA
jgi:predicted nucleic acid-binding protein